MNQKHLVLRLVAACFVLTASDPGFAQTWRLTSAPSNYDWQSVACSTNGSKLVAVASDDGYGDGGPVCASTNAGATWAQTSAPTN